MVSARIVPVGLSPPCGKLTPTARGCAVSLREREWPAGQLSGVQFDTLQASLLDVLGKHAILFMTRYLLRE